MPKTPHAAVFAAAPARDENPAFVELEEIKRLAESLTARGSGRGSTPIKLARALCAIRNNKMFYSYRCRSFREFARRELPICRTTANALMRIVTTFESFGWTRQQIDELEAVGWAKLAEVLPILNKDNAAFWLHRAQDLKMPEFRRLVHQAKLAMGVKKPE